MILITLPEGPTGLLLAMIHLHTICWLVLATIHLHTKYEVPSFIHSRDRMGPKFKKWVT